MLDETSPYTLIFSFRRHDSPVTSISFSSDAKFMLSGDLNGFCVLWDFSSRLPLRKWRAHEGQILLVQFLSTHFILTSGRSESIKIWKLNLSCVSTIDKPINYAQLEILSKSLCSPSILSLQEKNSCLIITPSSNDDHTFDLYAMHLNFKGKTFTPLQRNIHNESQRKKDYFITALCLYSPTKPSILIGYSDGHFSHWEIVANRPSLMSSFSFSSQPITSICTDKKHKIGVAGGFGPIISIFGLSPNESSYSPIFSSLNVEAEGTSSIAFRDDNKRFAVAGYDNRIRIFSRNGKLLSICNPGPSKINWIGFSPTDFQNLSLNPSHPLWEINTSDLLAVATQDSKILLYKT
ncbi:ASTRA complex subunit [Coelomomyces lativittatus]|nr:ASTRA complex subunit [Coelomomyces lativittatus]KAJ1515980.1 ASTRA complex subunit [Coelomomyces lativittatus]KAJ1516203.1 ASTRA complex subunit [Coelomomyces lativittatus]